MAADDFISMILLLRRYYLKDFAQSIAKSCNLHVQAWQAPLCVRYAQPRARMNATVPPAAPWARYRAVFVSDFHLGTRGCRANFLADFLRRVHCEKLFLVGDIIACGFGRAS
jgi:hypothetical protein